MPQDDMPRWERAAEDRRTHGGLGLPAEVPRWLLPVVFAFLTANALKQAVQADGRLDVLWAVVGVLLWSSLFVVIVRRNSRQR